MKKNQILSGCDTSVIASGWKISAYSDSFGAAVPDADVFFRNKRKIKMIVHNADIRGFFQQEKIPVPMEWRKIVITADGIVRERQMFR